jgi:hypothetical protein
MPQALVAAGVGLTVAALGVAGLVWLRWRLLRTRPGFFPCLVVEGTGTRRRERPGMAAFGADALEWFARDSVWMAPAHRWLRHGLAINARDAGARVGWQVVRLGCEDDEYLLVLTRGAASGLLSWIEAGPTRAER